MTTDDEFILHAGSRSRLRNRAIILIAFAAVAIYALIHALRAVKGDSNGSVGAIVVPVAIAVGCLGAAVLAISQWWEDATHFWVEGDRIGVRHGTARLRGRTVWLDRSEPVVLHGEPARGAFILFVEQSGSRVRVGDSVAIAPLQSTNWDAWMRSHGATVEHRWDKTR